MEHLIKMKMYADLIGNYKNLKITSLRDNIKLMAELGDEELMGVVPKSLEDYNKKLPPFGYWTDERGIKHKGIIPEEYRRKPTLPAYKLTYNDYQGPRTSDPRLI